MAYILGMGLIQTLGVDFSLKCISTLTSSMQGIYLLMSNIHNTVETKDVSKTLMELDFYADLKLLDILLKEINIDINHTNTLALCLEMLKNCVTDIEKELTEIQNKNIYNQSLWLKFRAYDFDDNITTLKILRLNLDNRKKSLFDILKINNYLVPICKQDNDLEEMSIINVP